MKEIAIATRFRQQLIDITGPLQEAVEELRIRTGILVVQSPHTTLALTVNENADPAVIEDMLSHLSTMVPRDPGFRHREDNSDSHIKVSLVGPSLSLIIDRGRIQLGTWQGVYACEFDGPRRRRIWVQVVNGEPATG